jgi:hypothetical protein
MHEHRGDCRKLLPFFGAVVGMLAAKSPLRALRFEGCVLTSDILPQLRLLTSCTALHLHDIAHEAGPPLQLDLLQVCLTADCSHLLMQGTPPCMVKTLEQTPGQSHMQQVLVDRRTLCRGEGDDILMRRRRCRTYVISQRHSHLRVTCVTPCPVACLPVAGFVVAA